MTVEIGLVFGILAAALVLFVTERIPMDVVALCVLGVLAITGLVSPSQAFSGFSNPAVITVWAMFMLSAALTHTGVANVLGRQVMRLAGRGEIRMVIVIMTTSAVMSAFMNNIGVAALLLPVVMDIARRTGRAPSRLLMPLAFGSLLGGLTTLVGTPPNLLVSEALVERKLDGFGLFDFTPVGGGVMVAGIAFVALVGRRWLPQHDPGRDSTTAAKDLERHYAVHERTVSMRVGPGSRLAGRSLADSRLGSAVGLNVFSVLRGGRTVPTPRADFVLAEGDRLVVEGRLDRLRELRAWRELELEDHAPGPAVLSAERAGIAELAVAAGSDVTGKTLGELRFRGRYGAIVLAIQRKGSARFRGLTDVRLEEADRLLVLGNAERIEDLRASAAFDAVDGATAAETGWARDLDEHLFVIRVPNDSVLVGRGLGDARLGDALGLGVLGIERDGQRLLLPEPTDTIHANDRLVVRGMAEDLEVFRGLQALEIEGGEGLETTGLDQERIGFVEAILAPRSALAGKTLKELDFRNRHGLQAMAVLRQGEVLRDDLRDLPLRFGDALLLFGRREAIGALRDVRDLIVLTQDLQEAPRTERAIPAALIMAATLAPVLAGWLPISIAAVAGATLMVLVGCLTMEQAYRAIEWRSIFLIAGMLPLGTALQETKAAEFAAVQLLELAGPLGPWGVIATLYVLTALATTVIPTAALVVLMSPIALNASAELGISEHAVMMAIAMAASASFTSPISHPANILVMGPGGYKFRDYVKLGIPLAIVVMAVTFAVLPFVWPLEP